MIRDSGSVKLYCFQRTGQPQHLLEEALQRGKVPLTEIRDRPKVRLVPGREHTKRHVLDQAALDPARREHADAVPVHQHLGQHHRVVRRVATLVVFVHPQDRR
jgi:hypothetical protein